MDTVVFQSTKATDYFGKKMVLVKINAEVDTTVARQMAISGYPTLVMVDAKGEEIDRVIGYMETDPFLKQLDDYQAGIGTLADLLNKAKTDTSRQLAYDVAEKYKYRGKPEDATAWYEKVIVAAPKDSLAFESRMALADMSRRAKNWDESVAAFQAIAKDFEAVPICVGQSKMALANVYIRQKKWDDALAIYNDLAVNTTYKGMDFVADAQWYQGYTLGKKGDTAAAITAFEQFIKNNPTSADTADARERIEKLKSPAPTEKK